MNQTVGFGALLIAAVATRALLRTWRRVSSGTRLRWWHIAAGINGAVFITVTAAAAPKIGVALLAVSLVAGQTVGSLFADSLGLGPAGRQHLTSVRALSAALALLAVGIGTLGSRSQPDASLLALAVIAGAGFPISQAAVGQVASITGEPLVAGSLNFGVAGLFTLAIALVTTGASPRYGWATAPPVEWVGGIIGAATVVVIALSIRTLGVFRLTLSVVAGQTVGGVIIDFVAPAAGGHATAWTGVGAALTLLAVAVSGLSRGRSAGAGDV